jgi:hypothetical protein
MIEKIVSAVTMMAPITAARSMAKV